VPSESILTILFKHEELKKTALMLRRTPPINFKLTCLARFTIDYVGVTHAFIGLRLLVAFVKGESD